MERLTEWYKSTHRLLRAGSKKHLSSLAEAAEGDVVENAVASLESEATSPKKRHSMETLRSRAALAAAGAAAPAAGACWRHV